MQMNYRYILIILLAFLGGACEKNESKYIYDEINFEFDNTLKVNKEFHFVFMIPTRDGFIIPAYGKKDKLMIQGVVSNENSYNEVIAFVEKRLPKHKIDSTRLTINKNTYDELWEAVNKNNLQ